MFQKKKRIYGKNKNYSVINKLLKEEKINERFLAVVNQLSLEEVIAIKLEMASKASGGNIFGIPIWLSLRDICRDAALKFALSTARTKADAASFLGLNISAFKHYLKKYEIISYFQENSDENV